MEKPQAVKMGKELMEAAKIIAKKYGMDVKRGSGSYDDESYKLSNITFFDVVEGETGNSRFTPAELRKMKLEFEFRQDVGRIDDKFKVGQSVNNGRGDVWKIIGWKSRNRKYPILVEDVVTGKNFKLTPDQLKSFTVVAA